MVADNSTNFNGNLGSTSMLKEYKRILSDHLTDKKQEGGGCPPPSCFLSLSFIRF